MVERTNGNPPGISVGTLEIGDVVVTRVDGEIDMTTVGVVRAEVTARLDLRPAAFVIDLSGVEFFTSVGISMLVQAQRSAQRDGIAFAVVASQRLVLRSLRMTGMEAALPLFDSLTRALATIALRRPAAAADDRVEPPA